MLLNNGICTTPCPYKTPYGACQVTACINNTNTLTIYNTLPVNKMGNKEIYDYNDPDFGIGIYS